MSGTETEPSNPQLVVRVAPGADEWGTCDDDRWRHDLYELEQDLERALRGAVQPAVVRRDIKGVELIEVVLAFGSAGVFTAAVEVFKAWLAKKPDRRTLDVTWLGRDGNRTLRIDATNIGGGEIAQILGTVHKEE